MLHMEADDREVKPRKMGVRIVISGIRDREDAAVPRPALDSIVRRISESMGELGLKAKIESSEC
jgi:hypothetical protein